MLAALFLSACGGDDKVSAECEEFDQSAQVAADSLKGRTAEFMALVRESISSQVDWEYASYPQEPTRVVEVLTATVARNQPTTAEKLAVIKNKTLPDYRVALRLIADNPNCGDPIKVAQAKESLENLPSSTVFTAQGAMRQ